MLTAALESRIQELEDRIALEDLVARLYELLDEQRFDELGSVYTDDVVLDFPSGRMEGLDQVVATARRRAHQFAGQHHVNTDVLVELDGDRAQVRTNHLAVHRTDAEDPAEHFDAGIVHRFEAKRTPAGWRFARGEAELKWTDGTPPGH